MVIADLIVESVWRNRLESETIRAAIGIEIRRAPSNAMLSRIMLAARQAAFAQNLMPLAQCMAAVRGFEATSLPKNTDGLAE